MVLGDKNHDPHLDNLQTLKINNSIEYIEKNKNIMC